MVIILIVISMYILNKLNKESFLNEISEAANLERYILSLNPVEMYSTKSKISRYFCN